MQKPLSERLKEMRAERFGVSPPSRDTEEESPKPAPKRGKKPVRKVRAK